MKNLFIILSAIMFFASPAFANSFTGNGPVMASFQKDFRNAEEVQWSMIDNYYKASFMLEDQHVTAFYEENGHLLALTRNISTTQLPLALGLELKRNLGHYWVTELFEFTSEDGTAYYITLEDGSESILMRSSGHSDWLRVRKTAK